MSRFPHQIVYHVQFAIYIYIRNTHPTVLPAKAHAYENYGITLETEVSIKFAVKFTLCASYNYCPT